jgi:vacuolar protein sorting-associated protein 13A/C
MLWNTYSITSKSMRSPTSSLAVVSQTPEEEARKHAFSLLVELNTISLNIFSGSGFDHPSLLEVSLSDFSLNKVRVTYDSFTNNSTSLLMVLESFSVEDKRSGKNLFQRVILPPASSDHPLLSFSFETNHKGDSIMEFDFDSPRVIFAFDYLHAVKNFFIPPVDGQKHKSQQYDADLYVIDQESTPKVKGKSSSLWYRFKVSKLDFTLLENPQIEDSEAVVLKITELTLKYEDVFRFEVSKVATYMHRMDDTEGTSVRIIQDFNLGITMDLNRRTGGQLISTVVMNFQPLVFRISYHDLLVMLNVFNRVSELSETSKESQMERDVTSFSDAREDPELDSFEVRNERVA